MRKGPADDDGPLADDLLVARLRKGDVGALNIIFSNYVRPLCDYAFRYVKSVDEAEELVQAVFVKLWHDRATIAIRGSIAQFLYTAVRNRSLDYLKHELVKENWRSRVVHYDNATSSILNAQTPESILEASERAAAIARALAELPLRRRQVCELRWKEGLSYAQIAIKLGISEKTVKNQLARGIEQVRSRMREL